MSFGYPGYDARGRVKSRGAQVIHSEIHSAVYLWRLNDGRLSKIRPYILLHMMPFILILLLAAYVGGNAYIFTRALQALPPVPVALRWLFGLAYWGYALSIFFVFLFREREHADAWGHFFFQVSTGWLVFTLYMVIALLAADLLRLFVPTFRYGFICALGVTLSLLVYGYATYKRPVLREVDIVTDRLPAGSLGMKIVGISDVHLGLGTTRDALRRYVDLINAQHPDVILISGDLIDSDVRLVEEAAMDEELSRLHATQGIYMVPGNHEYISGIEACKRFIRGRTNFHFLIDSIASVPGGLCIVGRDDRTNSARHSLPELVARVDSVAPIIVLDHQPTDLTQAERADVDLIFCGHTHHGQVWPLSLITDALFDVSYGYTRRGRTHIYVSSGLSLWGPPFRIGTRSELVVFRLIPAEL